MFQALNVRFVRFPESTRCYLNPNGNEPSDLETPPTFITQEYWLMCEDVPFVTDRRPCALSSRLVLSLSRSSTSRNRKKTSLHSGWVSNNLLPRQQQQQQQPSVSLSEPLKEQRVTFISSPKQTHPGVYPTMMVQLREFGHGRSHKYNPAWGDAGGKRANTCFSPYLAVWTITAVSDSTFSLSCSRSQDALSLATPAFPSSHDAQRTAELN